MPRNIGSKSKGLQVLLSLVVCLLHIPTPVAAQDDPTVEAGCGQGSGGLLIAPKRVVFAGRTRSAEVQLMNHGCKPTTYRVEVIEMRMDEAGRLSVVAEADGSSLGRMLRFAPRQVTVEPGERQTVRLLLRRPADLEPGEYRSHLRLKAIPDAVETGTTGPLPAGEGGLSLRLIALPGIAIPIILRHGQLSTTLRLSDLSVEPAASPPRLTLRLDRQGDRSVYGDLSAVFVPPTGEAIPVGIGKGIALYAATASRTISLPLQLPDGSSLAAGRLRVSFRSRPEADGGGVPITASGEIILP